MKGPQIERWGVRRATPRARSADAALNQTIKTNFLIVVCGVGPLAMCWFTAASYEALTGQTLNEGGLSPDGVTGMILGLPAYIAGMMLLPCLLLAAIALVGLGAYNITARQCLRGREGSG